MIRSLNNFIVRASQSPPLFMLATVLGLPVLFLCLFPIMQAFRTVTAGLQPFDWQDNLTAAAVYQQLPAYTDASRQLYVAHAFMDCIFPVFVAVFFGAIAAWALRKGIPRLYGSINHYGLFTLYFFSVPFDWMENLMSLIAIFGYPERYPVVAALLVSAKHVKLFAEPLIPGATALCIVGAGSGRIAARFASSRQLVR